jgi:hypothetical protein
MRKWIAIGLFAVLVIGIVLMSGCTNTGSTSAAPVATPTPQIVYVTVLVTPTPISTIAAPTAKYTAGDIIWESGSNYDTELQSLHGVYIVSVNAESYNYEFVWKDDGETHWSRVYPNVRISDIESLETSYPRKVDHVEASTITSDYSSKAAFDAATSGSSSSGSSGSSSPLTLSGSGDDTRSFSVTGGGGFLVTGSYSGAHNFIVHIVDSRGEVEVFVFNEIGSYSGRKIIQLDPGTHYLEVQSSGSWTITLTPT